MLPPIFLEMKGKIGDLTTKFGQVDSSVDKVTTQGAGKFQRMSALSGAALAGIGAAALGSVGAVGAFMGASIGSARDLGETLSKSRVIFGENMKAVDAWSKNAATSLGLSRQAALETAAGFGDMFSQLGMSSATAAKMSMTVTQLSADIGSFNNLPTAEVADMISGAFRGEYDSLQRVIPNISDARVKTEALNMTHKKSAEALTAAEKAQAVLSIVQKDGARAAGDFARTSGGLANQQKIMAAQFEDAKAKLGNALLPVLTRAAVVMTGTVIPAVTNLGATLASAGRFVSANATAFKTLAVVIGLIAAATAAHTVIMAVNSGAMKAWFVSTRLIRGATAAWTAGQWLLNFALTANPIGIVVVAIAALIAVIVLIATKTTWFQTAWRATWGAVTRATSSAASFVMSGFRSIGRAATATIGFFSSMASGVRARLSAVVSAVTSIPGRARAALGNLGGLLYNSGRALIEGLVRGIVNMAGNVAGAVRGVLQRARDLLPFSPAKEGPFSGRGWTLYSGEAMSGALATGIWSKVGAVRTAAAGLAAAAHPGDLGAAFSGGAGRIGGSASGAGSSLAAGSGGTHVHVNIDGRQLFEFVLQRAQQNKRRNGTTGLI